MYINFAYVSVLLHILFFSIVYLNHRLDIENNKSHKLLLNLFH